MSILTTFRIYLGGVQGVGKTTLAKKIIKKYPNMVHCSSSEILMDHFQIKDRKTLEKISINQKERDIIFLNFYIKHRFLILDGHFKLTTLDKKIFNLFFFIDALDETILLRRQIDSTRERLAELPAIKQERRKELLCAKKFMIKPINIINEGNVTKIAEKMEKIIENYINVS